MWFKPQVNKGKVKASQVLERFARKDEGAVTVDWVVLTAAVIGLSLGAVVAVRSGVLSLGSAINDSLRTASLPSLSNGTGDGSLTPTPVPLPPVTILPVPTDPVVTDPPAPAPGEPVAGPIASPRDDCPPAFPGCLPGLPPPMINPPATGAPGLVPPTPPGRRETLPVRPSPNR